MDNATNALARVGSEITGQVADYTGDVLIILGEIFCFAGFILALWLIVRQIDKFGE